MAISQIHSFLVKPNKKAEESDPIRGTAVVAGNRLFEMLAKIYERAEEECIFEIAFLPGEDGTQMNDCKDLIVAYSDIRASPRGRGECVRMRQPKRGEPISNF